MTPLRIIPATAILVALAACDVPSVAQAPLQLRATPAPVAAPAKPAVAKPVALRVTHSEVGGLAEGGGQVSASDADSDDDGDSDSDDGDASSSGGVSSGGGDSIGGSGSTNDAGSSGIGLGGLGGSGSATW